MRKSSIYQCIGKQLGGITLIDALGLKNGRMMASCQCNTCKKIFSTQFHNIYKGQYKSCGCLKFQKNKNNSKWKGCGNISGSYFYSLKKGAEARGLDFQITIEDLWDLFKYQNGKCFFSGEDLFFSATRKSHNGTASLDRKDPKKGYCKGNLQWVHQNINYMKQQMNNEDFLELIQKIHKFNYE